MFGEEIIFLKVNTMGKGIDKDAIGAIEECFLFFNVVMSNCNFVIVQCVVLKRFFTQNNSK